MLLTTPPSPTATQRSVAVSETCPSGTTLQHGLCLSEDKKSDELARILHSQFTADKLSAVIAGVWHNGKPVLFGALGDSMPGVPATPDMHHMLGNLTTPMLTTAALEQVEAGKLSLDDKVSKWYPSLPGADAVTIEMLLHNTAGYSQYTAQSEYSRRPPARPLAS